MSRTLSREGIGITLTCISDRDNVTRPGPATGSSYWVQRPGGTDFTGKDLGNLDLSWVNFTDANLNGSNLNGSNARGANFKSTTLTGSTFGNAELAEVRSGGITGAFTTARQYYAVNSGLIVGPSVNLWNEDLSGQDLSGQDLSGLNLTNVKAYGANFSNANVTGANVTGADLRATLTGATATSLVGNPGKLNAGHYMSGRDLIIPG